MSNGDRDYEGELEELKDKTDMEIEALQNELDETVAELKAELAEANEAKAQLSEIVNKINEVDDADAIALSWLYANCSSFTIKYSKDSGRINVQGVCDSKEAGYVTQYTPRVYRANKKPPYLIHPEDTFKRNRVINFNYFAKDENLAQVVEGLIIFYCPGDIEVDGQPLSDDREANYGNQKLWVAVTDREDFSTLEKPIDPVTGLWVTL